MTPVGINVRKRMLCIVMIKKEKKVTREISYSVKEPLVHGVIVSLKDHVLFLIFTRIPLRTGFKFG